MAKSLKEIETEAEQLSMKERAALIEHLLATLDLGEDEDVEAAWMREAEQRYSDYRAGKIKGRDARQIFAGLRKN